MASINDTVRFSHRRAFLGVLAGTTALISTAASAQTTPVPAAGKDHTKTAPTDQETDEIVVTARRVEENIQKVPVAVTALGENSLKRLSIINPTELQFHAPSIQMTTTLGRLSGGFTIRGLSGGTQTYFAEIPGGPTESSAPLYDVGSVQILNGPQGTLFGRANTAGAVVVSPRFADPSKIEGSFDAGFGSLGLNRFTAMINLPIIKDELAIRFAANRYHLDGYTTTLTRGEKLNENNNESFRVSFTWKPGGGRFTVKGLYDYYNVDEAPGAFVLQAANPTLAIYNLPASISAPNGALLGNIVFGAACTTAVANGLSASVNNCIDDRLKTLQSIKSSLVAEAARTANGGNALRYVPDSLNIAPRETLKKHTFVLNAGYDFGNLGPTTLEVRNIFGFQAFRGNSLWSADGLGGKIQDVEGTGTSYIFTGSGQESGSQAIFGVGPYQKIYTNEAQARGIIAKDLMNWTVGYYIQSSPYPKNPDGIRILSRVFSGVTQPNLGYTPAYNFSNGGYTKQEAVYGQASLNLVSLAPFLDSLHFTGGIRKSWDTDILRELVLTTNVATGAFLPTSTQTTSQATSSGWNSNLSLEAGITPDLLVYLARRSGYRPGGLNTATNASNLPSFTPVYQPEKVKDLELGIKYSFNVGGAQFRLNGAAYKTDYDGIQVLYSASNNGVTTAYTVNAGAARIKGLELQAQVRVRNFELTGTYSLTDAKYTKFVGPDPLGLIKPGNTRCLPPASTAICLLDLSDTPFPVVARNQFSVDARYTLPFPESIGDIVLGGSLSYQSRRYFSAQAQRQIEVYGEALRDIISQKPYARLNARLEWNKIYGSKVSVAAFLNNLTDVDYKLTTITQLHSLGTSVSLFGEPRTYGFSIGYAF